MGRPETLGIVGAGSVGQAFGRLLAPEFNLLVASRSGADEAAKFAGGGAKAVTLEDLAAASDCIVVAVPDRAVPEVAARLSARAPGVVLQTCGSLGPSDLGPLLGGCTSCATFHPLQTIPDPVAGVAALRGSVFGVCGTGAAAAWCDRLAGSLGGMVVTLAEDRLPVYHAAAVIASNCAVVLADAALELMELAGLERAAAARAVRPLMESSVGNALTMNAGQALTGPVARGDADTVRRHLDAMQDLPAPLRELYREFGQHLLPLTVRRGLSPADAEAVRLALAED